jgi:uncharacterized membrane protein YvlD (DUF360 family)
MTVGGALRAALIDFYHQSWRLAAFNTALSVAALVIAYLTVFVHPLLALLAVVLGPLFAALTHCAVWLAQNDELHFEDAVVGLRLHWRRGLALEAFTLLAVALGVVAIRFYGQDHWLFTVFVADVLAVFAAVQLLAWPRAVHDRERQLHRVLGDALSDFLRRPLPTLALGVMLFVVNALGFAAAVMPFLTLTIAYSVLAVAHFALPQSALRELETGRS